MKTHDLCVGISKWVDRESGQERTQWMKVGAMFQNEKGNISIKIEAVPIGRNDDGDLWLSAFVPKPREDKVAPGYVANQPPVVQQPIPQMSAPVQEVPDDESIPF